ncbi:MAG: Zn-dependent hydrolase [Alphaproteobacteria bacterium]|nr:Zn-dependent hydrolase [Alphaproteobacteria bacterium]
MTVSPPAGAIAPTASSVATKGPAPFAATQALAQRVFAELYAATRTSDAPGAGVSRPCYDAPEQKAHDIVAAAAKAEGLETSVDRAGNLWLDLPGRDADAPFICIGSHLDSVPEGGNYDGAAGVVAGLMALAHMRRNGIVLPVPVRTVALRGEESAWFGPSFFGSKGLFGQLTEKEFDARRRDSGRPLRDYMAQSGVCDMAALQAGEVLLRPEQVHAYLELHIEQGPVMISRRLAAATVPGIRGNVRHYRAACMGENAHSGAVPRWLRHDAMMAMADLMMRLDEHWRVLLERGLDMVLTFGICGTDPKVHALTKVPGEVNFSLDIRSQDIATLEAFYRLFQTEAAVVAQQRGVRFVLDERAGTDPQRMDERWVKRCQKVLAEMGHEPATVPSGAGHDAMVFAAQGVPSVMVFVRNEHGSHNPRETMTMADFMIGAEALARAAIDPVRER